MKILCLLTNIIGGALVLASYAYGLSQTPNGIATLWGGVPLFLRPWYGVGMLAAMLGYLACSYFVIFHVNAIQARIFSYYNYNIFTYIYALILIPSMFFMSLTFKMASEPSPLTWIALRIILFLVALGALFVIIALAGLKPRGSNWAYWLAIFGSSLFFLHTFVLDALIWPYFFRK